MKVALTIAGSDSGGGAGIQADIKTFHAHGVFGASVITAITAQNTVAVHRAMELPTDIIEAQLDAVFGDLDVAAMKTGMLSSAEIVHAVAARLERQSRRRLVVDPVMISKSGYPLLHEDAIASVKTQLLPLAHIVTPNIHEAQLLAGLEIVSLDDMKEAACRIREYGSAVVLVKGGHADGVRAIDVLYDGTRFRTYESEFIATTNTHGTGCTLSAAITARLALGESAATAVEHAKYYITKAIESALDIGEGHGPTNHFYFIGPADFMEK